MDHFQVWSGLHNVWDFCFYMSIQHLYIWLKLAYFYRRLFSWNARVLSPLLYKTASTGDRGFWIQIYSILLSDPCVNEDSENTSYSISICSRSHLIFVCTLEMFAPSRIPFAGSDIAEPPRPDWARTRTLTRVSQIIESFIPFVSSSILFRIYRRIEIKSVSVSRGCVGSTWSFAHLRKCRQTQRQARPGPGAPRGPGGGGRGLRPSAPPLGRSLAGTFLCWEILSFCKEFSGPPLHWRISM